MIPHLEEPVLALGPLRITAFGTLAVTSVCVGFAVAARSAERFGLERAFAERALAWTIFWGFVGSHLLDLAAYRPEVLVREPLEVLRIWSGMSSMGGIAGGLTAAIAVVLRAGRPPADVLRFVDLLGFAFPFAWIFGRAGCALRHDHLGVASESLLAVAFPAGPRFDLGLLELLLTLPIAAAFAWLARRPRPSGLYVSLFFVVYGPARFALDTLRAEDLRHLGWTAAQYACVAATLAGGAGLIGLARRKTTL